MQTKTRSYKRQFRNANPPRICRAVPAVLENTAMDATRKLLDVSGKRVKPSEAEIKVDFRGKDPVVTLGSRFYGKWMKRTTFTVPANQLFNFQPFSKV